MTLVTFYIAPAKLDKKHNETTNDGDELPKLGEVVKELLANNKTIRPKILFTPNNTLAWRIIKRVCLLLMCAAHHMHTYCVYVYFNMLCFTALCYEQANRTLAAVDTIRAVTEQLINCSRYLNQSLTEFGPRLREVKSF